MGYILEVTDFARIQKLAEAFHRRGFVRIEDRTFEIKSYCPGPGIVPDSATFHLDLRRGVQVAPEVIITNLAGLSLSHYGRPRSTSTKWRGPEDGLPPVGTVCEFRRTLPGAPWKAATILCVGEKRVFFRDNDGDELSRSHGEVVFRPIRTPEQIAAEEREAEIVELVKAILPVQGEITRVIAVHLHSVGYRKFEITEDEQP